MSRSWGRIGHTWRLVDVAVHWYLGAVPRPRVHAGRLADGFWVGLSIGDENSDPIVGIDFTVHAPLAGYGMADGPLLGHATP